MMGGGMGGYGGGKDRGGKGWGGKGASPYGKFHIDESGGVLGEFTGTIKSFGEWKGFGFIESAELQAMGYKDAFLHGEMKKGYQVGHTVKFTAFINGKGQVQAKDLKSGLK